MSTMRLVKNDFLALILQWALYSFRSLLSTYLYHGLSENAGRICFQKTVKREPRIGEKCTDVNMPKSNVYGEKFPVSFSVPVRNFLPSI